MAPDRPATADENMVTSVVVMTRESRGSRATSVWAVGFVGLVVGAVLVATLLVSSGGEITGLLAFGEESAAITDHAEAVLGRPIETRENLGHDGRFFFLQTLDPLYLDPDAHAHLFDRPVYRGQRMLYPLLAGGGGLVPDGLVPWTMVLTNVVAIAVGTAGTAALARRFGGSEWWGLAFALNLGLIFELDISGAGIVAFAAAMWGTVALEDGRIRRATAWFVVSVLAREVMLLYLAGVCLLRLRWTRRVPWLLGGVPAAAVGCWALYLRVRLDEGTGIDEVQELGLPFDGLRRAVPVFVDRPLDLVVIVGLVAVMVLLVVRAVRTPSYVGWGSIGFVVLATLFTRQIWWRGFDITRATAPVITAYVLLAFVISAVNRPVRYS